MVPNGYNILEGGLGGAGFKGKTHKQETIDKIVKKLKQRYINNPEERKKSSERVKEFYKNNPQFGQELSKRMLNSEKWQKAVEEHKFGNNGRKPSEQTKEKISETIKKNYSKIDEKERKNMINGFKIGRYTKNNELVDTFESISKAAKTLNFPKASIIYAIKNKKLYRNFFWKKII